MNFTNVAEYINKTMSWWAVVVAAAIVVLAVTLTLLAASMRRTSVLARSRAKYDDKLRRTSAGARAAFSRDTPRLDTVGDADLIRLADAAVAGVDDAYDSAGRLVRGTRPRVDVAIDAYEELRYRGNGARIREHALLLRHGIPGFDHVVNATRAERLEAEAGLPAVVAVDERQRYATTEQRIVADMRRRGSNVRVAAAVVRDDPQNSHDSGVTRSVAASIARLWSGGDRPDAARGTEEVRRWLEAPGNGLSDDRRRAAEVALDAVCRNTEPLSTTVLTEPEVLALVWDRIHAGENVENRDALRSNLLTELSEMAQHGMSVCTSGRVARLLGTLDGVDDEVAIKPDWALNAEMMNRASAVRERALAAADAETRAAIDALDPTVAQVALYDGFAAFVKAEIRDALRRDYADAGVLSREALDRRIDVWIDGVM